MKVWAYYIGSNGRVIADSSFKDELNVWHTALGWPSDDEIKLAKARGDVVQQIEFTTPARPQVQIGTCLCTKEYYRRCPVHGTVQYRR